MAKSMIDRLETRVRYHLLRSLPEAGRDHLSDASLHTLLIEYGTWRDRFVPPIPRTVKISSELMRNPQAAFYAAHLRVLREKLERGADITAHLSERVQNPFANIAAPSYEHRSDRDALLSDWGIHHLHLTDRPNAKIVKRGDDVLLVAFTNEAAHFIDIVPHPTSTVGWAKQDIFNILVRNWPNAGLVHQLHGVVGLSQQYSDDDRRQLQNAGVTTMMEVDGKVYASYRLGQTTAGTPTVVSRRAMDFFARLDQWRNDFDKLFTSALNADKLRGRQFAYWSPHVDTTVPGFEEWAGFAATDELGIAFVQVARFI